MVVDAFLRQGIILHIDSQHTALPYHKTLWLGPPDPSCGLPDPVNFYDLKTQYFHPNGNHAWHYVIFGDEVTGSHVGAVVCRSHIVGVAELPGYNFEVGDGALFDFARSHGVCEPGAYTPPCQRAEGGVFMHELGHNLGLSHGGDENMDYKPNYISVMNNDFITLGIPSAAAPGGTVPVSWRLDYSDRVYPSLDENHLNEAVGPGGPPDDTESHVTAAT